MKSLWKDIGTGSNFLHVQGEGVDAKASKIILEVDNVLSAHSIKPNRLLRQWLQAEGICAYGSRNVKYKLFTTLSGSQQWEVSRTSSLIDQKVMEAQCSGYALFTRDLGNVIGEKSTSGLKAIYVWGWTKFPQVQPKASEIGNHGWVNFTFDGDLVVPADVTNLVIGRQSNGASPSFQTKEFAFYCLPLRRAQWEFFLSCRWGFTPVLGKNSKYGIDFSRTGRQDGQDTLTKLTWDEWNSTDITSYSKLQKYLEPDRL